MLRTSRLIVLLFVLLLSLIAVQAQQDASVTVTPQESTLTTPLTVTAEGLIPNETYRFDFIYAGTETVIYSTEAIADSDGVVELAIISEEGDDFGEYIVHVFAPDETLVASTTFSLIEGDAPELPELQEQFNISAEISISPIRNQRGAVHTIIIRDLPAGEIVTVEIHAESDNSLTYSREWIADENGRIQFEVFATDEDEAGRYNVTVLSGNDAVIAEAYFIVEDPFGLDGEIIITPAAAPAGTTHTVTVTELAPFADVRVELRPANALAPILEARVRADVNGNAVLKFETPEDAESGNYSVVVFVGDEEVAEGGLIIGDADEIETQIFITPTEGEIGTDHVVDISGLIPNETFTLEIIQADTDEVVFSTERTADDNGIFTMVISSEEGDDPGLYYINVLRDDEQIAQGELTIIGGETAQSDDFLPQLDSQSDVTITIDPESAPLESNHSIEIAGLDPDESVIVEIVFEGEVVYSTERIADANGEIILDIRSEASDVPGEYTVNVLRENEVIASASITFTEVELTDEDDEPDTSEDGVVITITPQEGEIGASHLIEIDGLEANEVVEIAVSFDDEAVFSTQRTADADGRVTINIAAEESDPTGEYTVSVLREDEVIAEATFTVTEAPAIVEDDLPLPEFNSDVEITIIPDSGGKGTTHEIVGTGLEPSEDVIIDIRLDGESVLEIPSTADENGEVLAVIVTENSDPVGEYTVVILRDETIIAEATFEITDDPIVTTPDLDGLDDSVSVTIEPPSGAIGTTHTITVTGLNPDEVVVLDVEFDGESVFSTERVADAEGTIILTIVSEDGDEEGEYKVSVIRDDVIIAQGGLVIGGEQQPDTVQGDSDAEILLEVSDNLTVQDPSMTFKFEGVEGQVVTIGLVSYDFDSFVILRDDSGRELASNDDGGGTLNSLIGPFELPYTGTYEVVASSYGYIFFDEPTPGSFTLTVATTTITELVIGEPLEDSLSPAVPFNLYTFEGTEGDVVTISMESSHFDAVLILQDEDGFDLFFNDDGGTETNSIIGPIILPYTGTYNVIAQSYSGVIGRGDFTIVVDTVDLIPIEYNEPDTIAFDEDTSAFYYTFEAEIGDVVSMIVDSNNGIDTTLTVIGPDGFILAADDDGGRGFDPEINNLILGIPGTYIVAIRPFSSGDFGTVEFTITRGETRTLENNQTTVRLNAKQSRDTIFFEGVAGETVTLNLATISGSAADLTITVLQDGYAIMSYSSTTGIPDDLSLGFVVPSNGTISITIEKYSPGTVVFDMSLERE